MDEDDIFEVDEKTEHLMSKRWHATFLEWMNQVTGANQSASTEEPRNTKTFTKSAPNKRQSYNMSMFEDFKILSKFQAR